MLPFMLSFVNSTAMLQNNNGGGYESACDLVHLGDRSELDTYKITELHLLMKLLDHVAPGGQ